MTVEDSGGNKVTTGYASVTLGLAQNAGGTLACTNPTVTANAGVATFAGCKITGTAGTYSLSATATGLSSATSNTSPSPPAPPPSSSSRPSPAAAPTARPGRPAGRERGGRLRQHVVTSFTSNVTLSIHTQPGTGATFSLRRQPSRRPGSGVATFTGCQISGALGSYTLTATSTTPALTGTSAAFTITIGRPPKLAFTTQPGGGADGVAWTASPR